MARPKQETLTLFPEIVSITRKFSDAQFGALMRAAFAYRFGGETYSGDDPAVDVAFQTVAGQIDRYIEICKGKSTVAPAALEHCGYTLAPLEDPFEAAMKGGA